MTIKASGRIRAVYAHNMIQLIKAADKVNKAGPDITREERNSVRAYVHIVFHMRKVYDGLPDISDKRFFRNLLMQYAREGKTYPTLNHLLSLRQTESESQ